MRKAHGEPMRRPSVLVVDDDAFSRAVVSKRIAKLSDVIEAEDGLDALHAENLAAEIDHLYQWPSDHNLLPGHVVCSSLAAMLYGLPQVGWAHPDLGAERKCKPADWWDWADRQLWIASRW